MEDIKKLLIEMCKEVMDGMAGDPGNGILGTPPRVFYLDFSQGEGESGAEPQETYRYENGSLEKVKPGTKGNTEPIRDSYFSEGHFCVRIDEKNRVAYLSFQVGPLFGRGYRFKIVAGENGNTLGEEELDWMS